MAETGYSVVSRKKRTELRLWIEQLAYGNPRLFRGFGIELEYRTGISRRTPRNFDLLEFRVVNRCADIINQRGTIRTNFQEKGDDACDVIETLTETFAGMINALRNEN